MIKKLFTFLLIILSILTIIIGYIEENTPLINNQKTYREVSTLFMNNLTEDKKNEEGNNHIK